MWGQNSGYTAMAMVVFFVIILVFVSGALGSLTAIKFFRYKEQMETVAADTSRNNRLTPTSERKEIPMPATTAWEEFESLWVVYSTAIRYTAPLVTDPTDLASLSRYLLGVAYTWTILLGNILGPGIAMRTAAQIQNKIKPEDVKNFGNSGILKSRWHIPILLNMLQLFFTQQWIKLILSVVASVIAWLWYRFYERDIWSGMGTTASTRAGRNDTMMIRGDGPGAVREMLLKGIIMTCIASVGHKIHPAFTIVFIGITACLTNHRLICFMACIFTHHWVFLTGLFSNRALTDEFDDRGIPAEATDRGEGFQQHAGGWEMNFGAIFGSEFMDQMNQDRTVSRRLDEWPVPRGDREENQN